MKIKDVNVYFLSTGLFKVFLFGNRYYTISIVNKYSTIYSNESPIVDYTYLQPFEFTMSTNKCETRESLMKLLSLC